MTKDDREWNDRAAAWCARGLRENSAVADDWARDVWSDRSGLLPDWLIQAGILIEPAPGGLVEAGKLSYGLCSAGYDARLGDEVWLVENRQLSDAPIDPKAFDRRLLQPLTPDAAGRFVMPPYSFVLSKTLERFALPRDVKGRCFDKSTYARCGVISMVTPLEPGWYGQVTIELANPTPHRAYLYPGEGVIQIEFDWLCASPRVSYADRGGKYQGQAGITPACVKPPTDLAPPAAAGLNCGSTDDTEVAPDW